MSFDDDFNPEALLGRTRSRPTDRVRKTRRTREGLPPRSAYEKAAPASRGIYDRLAMVFRDAPCYVSQGAPLLAKLLQERVEGEPLIVQHKTTGQRRPDSLVEELVTYMIERFWERLPNDLRKTNPLNVFLSADVWNPLVEETLDHQDTIRLSAANWVRGGPAAVEADPFYAPFIDDEQPTPTGSLSERLAAAKQQHEENN